MSEDVRERTMSVIVEAETVLYELRKRIALLHERNAELSVPEPPSYSPRLFDPEDTNGEDT